MTKIALFLLTTLAAAAQSPFEMLKPSLDVGIVVSDIDKAKDFYGTLLGLKPIAPLPLPDGKFIYRYQTGTATIKIRTAAKPAKYPTGVRDAVGFRLLTLYVDDFPEILKRLTAAGYPPPRIMDMKPANTRISFITDPDGNAIEMVSKPATVTERLGIGLTVADLERSRNFYRDVPGLHADAPGKSDMAIFTAGNTQINLLPGRSPDLPSHTGNVSDVLGFRYFTFIVKDVDAVAAKLKERGAKIVVPPVDFGAIARIMMVADPDGNWIEFAAVKPATP